MTTSLIFRRRFGRTLAGGAASVAGLAMFLLSFIEPVWGVMAIGAGWLSILPLYILGWYLARFFDEDKGDLEFLGLFLPMAAACLLVPLTVHGVFMVIADPSSINEHDIKSFGEWIRISGVLVGLAHVSLVVMSALHVRKMRQTPHDTSSAYKGWIALGVSVIVSCVPGALAFLIPPVLTAVTGVVFVPLMFFLARSKFRNERAEAMSRLVRHPQVAVVAKGIEFRPAYGQTKLVVWEEPFTVVLHRDHREEDEGICHLHVRLVQDTDGTCPNTVALTLVLPWETGMGQLDAKSEHLPCLKGQVASIFWSDLRYYAHLHGTRLPHGLETSPTANA